MYFNTRLLINTSRTCIYISCLSSSSQTIIYKLITVLSF